MKRASRDFYSIKNHRFDDAGMHEPILVAGDEAAARKVSDEVARRLGLTEAEIASLRSTKKD